jgi:hypothetical protein
VDGGRCGGGVRVEELGVTASVGREPTGVAVLLQYLKVYGIGDCSISNTRFLDPGGGGLWVDTTPPLRYRYLKELLVFGPRHELDVQDT